MLVIGAGFGRTGTNSLKEALEILLDGPCYHMFEVGDNDDLMLTPCWKDASRNKTKQQFTHSEAWCAMADGRADEVDLDRLLQGYKACVDWPSAAFFAELMAQYPRAKVVKDTID